MTLVPYDADKLDQLALRCLEIAATIREMANVYREQEIEGLRLHEAKAIEWLDRLEDWSRDAQGRMDRKMRALRGTRAAGKAIREQAKRKKTGRK